MARTNECMVCGSKFSSTSETKCTQCESLRPTCEGYRTDGEGSTLLWAVFNASDIASLDEERDIITDYLAEKLTGWTRHYSGPGRSFAHDPTARISRTRVLVTQACGLDI